MNILKMPCIVIVFFIILCVGILPAHAGKPKISAGRSYTMALKGDGTLWAWGINYAGQLGDGTTINRHSPVKIGSATNWIDVAAGSGHTMALKADGTLWAWGGNFSGQLGDGTTIDRYSPVKIGVATNWIAVSAGGSVTIALKSDGTLWQWGTRRDCTESECEPTFQSYFPVQVGAENNWTTAAAGYGVLAALKSDGTLWGWGFMDSCNYDHFGARNPVQIGTATNWAGVIAGGESFLLQKSDGTLWGWGDNSFGHFGDGTYGECFNLPQISIFRYTPLQIGSASNWGMVATTQLHALALKTDGTLWASGWNDQGQLGDGTTINRYTHVKIGIATNWVSVTVGNYHGTRGDLGGHSVALKQDGTLWGWGSNGDGQVGDGTTIDRHTPVLIASGFQIPQPIIRTKFLPAVYQLLLGE
jgi:alpha-tubulin suppressor-like RCC1 family protein